MDRMHERLKKTIEKIVEEGVVKIKTLDNQVSGFPHLLNDVSYFSSIVGNFQKDMVAAIMNEIMDKIIAEIERHHYIVRKESSAGKYISESLKNGKSFDEVCVDKDRSNSAWIFMDKDKKVWSDLEEETADCNGYME